MTFEQKKSALHWAFIIWAIAFILAIAFDAPGSTQPLTFEQRVRAALAKQPVYKEDKSPEFAEAKAAQLDALAHAIAEASRKPLVPVSQRDWAAMLITIARSETNFSLRIHRGECKKWECDRGRARGPWQNQRNQHTAPSWDELHGIEHSVVQARVASDMLRRTYWTCDPKRTGLNITWQEATITGYAGKRCGSQWPGLQVRLARYNDVRRALE